MSAAEVSIVRKAFPISLQYVLYADPIKVFDTLTVKEIISTWCDGGGKIDSEKDGDMEWFGGWATGKVLEYNRGKGLLSFTWRTTDWDKKAPDSFVRIQLRPHPAGTEILLEHGGFFSKEESDKHASGWTDHVFEPLNDVFTGVSPLEP
ncbi:MAG: hypothetical protein RL090_589 [Bacteroidota bacterium]|jgi:uncharacterized protein YndB with AHSA1/START domain